MKIHLFLNLQIYALFMNSTNLLFKSDTVKYLVESLRFAIFAAIYPRGLFFIRGFITF